MVAKRSLPERRNPLITEHAPPLEVLVERRRLGHTNLAIRPGQVGVSNATSPENLGVFDYAHLRAPLPKDLRGSGVFFPSGGSPPYPESYFLMRRSDNGYISATGMFKAAFPWASIEEDEAERRYHQSLPSAGSREVAGNVWISPEDALDLADEYDMRVWIVALLDPTPIEKGPKDKVKHEIQAPPKFIVPPERAIVPPSPASIRLRSRELRSASPSKNAAGRRIATPRKRSTRKSAKANSVPLVENGAANEHREGEHVLSRGSNAAVVNGEDAEATSADAPSTTGGGKVRIEVDETVEKSDDVEVTTTAVKVEVPPNHPELPLPESTEDMIAKAKQMVEEANKIDGRADGVQSLKRKADVVEEDEAEEGTEGQPSKKVKIQEDELKKAKVTNRALISLGATIALGTILPYFF